MKNIYIEKYLKLLKEAKTRKEKAAILDKLYEEGFEDGQNAK